MTRRQSQKRRLRRQNRPSYRPGHRERVQEWFCVWMSAVNELLLYVKKMWMLESRLCLQKVLGEDFQSP